MQLAPTTFPQATDPGGQRPRDVRSAAVRYATLGTTCLVLGTIEILSAAQRLASSMWSSAFHSAFTGNLFEAQGATKASHIVEASQAFSVRLAPWEIVRAVPFLVASALLVWIGVRLRRGDASALRVARSWSIGALVVLAGSALVQGLVTIPATIAFEKDLLGSLHAAGASNGSFDAIGFATSFTIAMIIAGAVGLTVLLASWPITLFFWSRKLERETL